MLSNHSLSVSMSAIGLGLLLAFCNFAGAEEAPKSGQSVQGLEQKRLALLGQVRDGAKALYQNARVSYSEVQAAERELLTARIEYAKTPADRIKACDQAIKIAQGWQQVIEANRALARSTHVELWRAQDFELQARIARAKADAGK